MIKNILFLYLLFCSSLAYSQTIPWPSTKVDTSYATLAKENLNLRIELNNLEERTNIQYDRISDQIAAASFFLTIFGLVFTIGGVFLGVYISRIWAKLENGKRDIEKSAMLAKISERKSNELFDAVQNDIKRVYADLKKTEILYVLDRLKHNPTHIRFFHNALASYELGPEYFEKVKNLFLNAKKQGVTGYLYVLCTRFGKECAVDQETNPFLISSLPFLYDKVLEEEYSELIHNITTGLKPYSNGYATSEFLTFLLKNPGNFKLNPLSIVFNTVNSLDDLTVFYNHLTLPKDDYGSIRSRFLDELESFFGPSNRSASEFVGNALKEIKIAQDDLKGL
jgi:hypothetical protein